MHSKKLSVGLTAVLAILAVTATTPVVIVARAVAQDAVAQEKSLYTERMLYSFRIQNPVSPSGLIFDAAGNLYGTGGGGQYREGMVYELTPREGGRFWTEKVLHNFHYLRPGSITDGALPNGLVFDAAGNLYGTTLGGGGFGCGIVYELSPTASGVWTETVLYTFTPYNGDGCEPTAGVIFDTAGNLYGTTREGGTHGGGNGTVFELTPTAGGGWTETILYSFGATATDGSQPFASLIFDTAGNLYSTTFMGGAYGAGTVFELTPTAGGPWTEKVLHSFDAVGPGGAGPQSGLIFDAAGNLYGSAGSVFELMPKANGHWLLKWLHIFRRVGDGSDSDGVLIFDASGNLYGTTANGGAYDEGTVFELTRNQDGFWTEMLLHSFDDNGENGDNDGIGPQGGVIFDAAGNLYGTTASGGARDGGGAVFEITRQP
jgi:uncharacterized repeat protein (TIGR03803 family)